jgi:tetratricopeptide (TPR) repeat protein
VKSSHFPIALLGIATLLAPILGGGLPLETGVVPAGGGWVSLLNGSDLPLLSQWWVSLFASLAAVILLAQRQVLQIPNTKIGSCLLGLLGLLGFSVLVSAFRFTTLAALMPWVTYAVVFFAVVAGAGRDRGPKALLLCLFLACILLSLIGINEFSATRGRIFAGWNNPNALAGMLILGLFSGIGLLTQLSSVRTLLAGLGIVIIGFALVLTQSRGGIYAAGFGLVVLSALCFAWNPVKRDALPTLGRIAACLICVVALTALLQNRPTAGGAPASRLASTSETQDQSVGFRLNLYKGAIAQIRDRPLGYGLGTFRYEGSRSGLTTQTVLTHNSYLQLGFEATPFAPLLLLIVGVVWLAQTGRGATKLPTESNMLRAAVVAGVVAIGAHSMTESSLHLFGIGFGFFVLLGVGILLSADSVSPEFTPRSLRLLAGIATILFLIQGLYVAVAECHRAAIRYAASQQDATGVAEGIERAITIAPSDGDAWYLAAFYERDPTKQHAFFERTVQLSPTTRYYRAYARALIAAGKREEALVQLRRGLERDPNNLPIWKLLFETYQSLNNSDQADAVARQLVAIEETQYFKIRSIPEIVPLETYRARAYLATRTADRNQRIELLKPALDGYLSFAGSTLELYRQDLAVGLVPGRTGETPESMRANIEEGRAIARSLRELYREVGEANRAAEADSALATFETALDSGFMLDPNR